MILEWGMKKSSASDAFGVRVFFRCVRCSSESLARAWLRWGLGGSYSVATCEWVGFFFFYVVYTRQLMHGHVWCTDLHSWVGFLTPLYFNMFMIHQPLIFQKMKLLRYVLLEIRSGWLLQTPLAVRWRLSLLRLTASLIFFRTEVVDFFFSRNLIILYWCMHICLIKNT